MDVLPIDPTTLVNSVSQGGPLVSLLFLVIVALILAIRMLFNRIIKLGDDRQTDLLNSTIAINNNTAALNSLAKLLEHRNG